MPTRVAPPEPIPSRLILCADDFAFSSTVSRVIADLARDGKLSATGCMTLMPNWPADSVLLADLPGHVEVGLHLVLTEERPLTAMPRFAPDGTLPTIGEVQRAVHDPDLPLDEIADEIVAQFDRFEQTMGRAPAFVDGHQHANVLPKIRDVVLAEVARRAPSAWLRTCEDRLGALLRRPFPGKALASAWHARGFAAAAEKADRRCNRGFAGHYGFRGDYEAVFPAFLRQPGSRHLVMCHPGTDDRPGDAIAAARVVEAAALRRLPVRDLAASQGLTFGP